MPEQARLRNRASRPETIRTQNERLVLDLLRDKGKLTRAELSEATSLTLPAIASITAGLVDDGLVREQKLAREGQGRGRPPVILEFIPDSSFSVGIRLGRTDTTIVLADALGREKARRTVSDFEDGTFETVTSGLVQAITSLFAQHDVALTALNAVGVAIQGSVDPETGKIQEILRFDWDEAPLAETLSRALDTPVQVIEAGRAGAVAEYVEGLARKHRNVIVIDVGAKMSAAIILNGRIVNGAHGLAGALGDCLVPGNPTVDKFDVRSEGDARLADIVLSPHLFDTLADAFPRLSRDDKSVWDQIDAARESDAEAAQAIGQGGYYMAHGVAWLANLFDPDMIIMSGGMSVVPQSFQDSFIEQVQAFVSPSLREGMSIRFSKLGTEGWVRGAVLAGLQGQSTSLEHLFDRASV